MRSLFLITCLLTFLLPTVAAADHHWCVGEDEVYVEVDPISADVLVFHDSALYNCCPDPITYEVHFGDATLFIVEHVAADPPCDCNCCMNLGVTIPDAQPGPWQVTFSWLDEETQVWTYWYGQITVPDVGQGYVPGDPVTTSSGCLDTTGMEEDPESQDSTWSAIKAIYR